MSKELTEKWKNKELKDGDYYVINKAGDIVCDYYIEILGHFDSVLTENVKEVLAPVPSYDHFSQLVKKVERLQEQVKEANEVIKWYAQPDTGSAKDYLEKWGVK